MSESGLISQCAKIPLGPNPMVNSFGGMLSRWHQVTQKVRKALGRQNHGPGGVESLCCPVEQLLGAGEGRDGVTLGRGRVA